MNVQRVMGNALELGLLFYTQVLCVCSVASDSLPARLIACQAPLYMEFSRLEYWSGLPFPTPGDLPHPEIKSEFLASCASQVNSLLLHHLGSHTQFSESQTTVYQTMILSHPPFSFSSSSSSTFKNCKFPRHLPPPIRIHRTMPKKVLMTQITTMVWLLTQSQASLSVKSSEVQEALLQIKLVEVMEF